MNTPNHLSDAEINELVENGRMPMSAQGRAYFDLGMALLGKLNPETMFKRPMIDLRRRAYDIDVSENLSAPRAEQWTAIDLNSYDGASEGGISSCIGRGPTPQAARLDLLEQIAEHDERPVRYKPIPGTVGRSDEPADYQPAPRNDYFEEPQE